MIVLDSGKQSPIYSVSLAAGGRRLAAVRGGLYHPWFDVWDVSAAARTRAAGSGVMTGMLAHPTRDVLLLWGRDGLAVAGPDDLAPAVTDAVHLMELAVAGDRLVGLAHRPPGRLLVGWGWAGDRPERRWQVGGDDLWEQLTAAPAGEWFAVRCGRVVGATVEVRASDAGRLLAAGAIPTDAGLLAVLGRGTAVLASAGRVLLFDPHTGREVAAVKPPGAGAVRGAAVAPDGRQVLACKDKAVYALDPETLAVRRAYTFPARGKPTCLAVAPDGLTAACGTTRGEVVVFDLD